MGLQIGLQAATHACEVVLCDASADALAIAPQRLRAYGEAHMAAGLVAGELDRPLARITLSPRQLSCCWHSRDALGRSPEEHWVHLKTSNPIESVFYGVKLRTNATNRMRVRENALHLVFKLVCRLGLNWRSISAPNQLTLLLAGHRYTGGKLGIDHPTQENAAAQLRRLPGRIFR